MALIFLLFIIISFFSILGYGFFFKNVFLGKSSKLDNGIIGFLGLFFFFFISYTTHLFFRHDYLHNSIIVLLGIIFLIISNLKSFKILNKNEYIIILFLIIGVFISKTHDDFPYYHLPNALHFVENKLEFGLGNLNHGFKHHSSIFYLYSIFYLPLIEYYLFNVINFFFILFFSFYAINQIVNDIKNKQFDNFSLIKLIYLVSIISIFNRIGEYGADITGQILVALILCSLLDLPKLIKKSKLLTRNILLSFVLVAYAVTIKTYFILYLILPLFAILFFRKNIEIIKEIIFSRVSFLLLFVATLFSIINISATGCIVYPISNLCFPKLFFWGIDLKTITVMSDWYEVWSKAGAGPSFREADPLIYIQNFNWLKNWINVYFFTKFSDFLGALLVIIILCGFILRSFISLSIKNFFLNSFKNYHLFVYLIIISLFSIWFMNFPSLRYGGYILVLSIIMIPLSFFVVFKIKNYSKLEKKIYLLILLAFLIFDIRNVKRINFEFNYQAANYFKDFPLYYVKKVTFEEKYLNGFKVYRVQGMCWTTPTPCLRSMNKKIEIINSYKFYSKND